MPDELTLEHFRFKASFVVVFVVVCSLIVLTLTTHHEGRYGVVIIRHCMLLKGMTCCIECQGPGIVLKQYHELSEQQDARWSWRSDQIQDPERFNIGEHLPQFSNVNLNSQLDSRMFQLRNDFD